MRLNPKEQSLILIETYGFSVVASIEAVVTDKNIVVVSGVNSVDCIICTSDIVVPLNISVSSTSVLLALHKPENSSAG